MLLYIMLYIVLAYLMLFVCIMLLFLPLISANAFYFHALSFFIPFLVCIMYSAFNLFVFPNSMFTSSLFFLYKYFFMKGL